MLYLRNLLHCISKMVFSNARRSDGLLSLEIFRSSQASLGRNFAELGNVHKNSPRHQVMSGKLKPEKLKHSVIIFGVNLYYIYGWSGYNFVLIFITFVVSITFTVNSSYIYCWYYI